jgi:hypothetical protein
MSAQIGVKIRIDNRNRSEGTQRGLNQDSPRRNGLKLERCEKVEARFGGSSGGWI